MTDDQLIELWLSAYASGTRSAYAAIGADETQVVELINLMLGAMRRDPAVLDSILNVINRHRTGDFDTALPELNIHLNDWKSA